MILRSNLSRNVKIPGRISSKNYLTIKMNTGNVRIAILDDYLNLAEPHFHKVRPQQAQITTFRDTLQGWTNGNASKADHQALVERLRPFNVICTMRERTHFPRPLLEQLPNLKLLLTTGTQHSTFDLAAASDLDIAVATAPGKGRTDLPANQRPDAKRDITKGFAHPTTQHTWALILALANGVVNDDATVKRGGWQTGLTTRLSGKTLGVCGLGRLGAATAKIGSIAFGMKVVCWSENLTQKKADKMAAEMGVPEYDAKGEKSFKVVSKADLFSTADVVSLHYVLSERSRGMVAEPELSTMKKSAFLVNTSRASLIDEKNLLETLMQGGILGAAFDVHEIEPLPEDSPWRMTKWGEDGRSQVLLTPHMGYFERDIMDTWYAETAENVERWLRGEEILHRLA